MPLLLFFASLRSSFIIEQAAKGNKGRRNQSFFLRVKITFDSLQGFLSKIHSNFWRIFTEGVIFKYLLSDEERKFLFYVSYLYFSWIKNFFSKYYLRREQKKFLRECHKSYLMWHFNLRLNDFEKNIIIFGGFISKRSDEGRQDA